MHAPVTTSYKACTMSASDEYGYSDQVQITDIFLKV